MNRKNILELYRDAKELTGFRESRKEKGWMPRLGPDDFRSVIRHGTYEGRKAVMQVSPHENLVKTANDFKHYQSVAAGKPMVLQIPKILQLGRSRGAWFLVQESAPSGERILDSYPLSAGYQKEEVAELYWKTVANFPKFDIGKWSASDYFLDRLNKWFAIGRKNGAVESGFITQGEKVEAVEVIFSELGCLRMESFFAHFSNADIVKAGDAYYIWGAEIVPKPEAAGIAHWLWGATLYAYQQNPKWWLDELNKWIDIFIEFVPENLGLGGADLGTIIRVNLLERFLGSLLVDLPLRRSPFDKLSEREIEKAKKVIRFAFLHFLR
jgi:hypothetical protein